MKEEREEDGRRGWDLIAPYHSSSESKKSLEERENVGVDPTLTIPMIQKGCIPNGEGTDSEPQAETVSWPLTSPLPQSLIFLSARLVSLHQQEKSVCILQVCHLSLPSVLFGSIDK